MIDALDGALTDTSDEVALLYDYADGLAPGQWVEVNNEPMLILEKNEAVLKVLRGTTSYTPQVHAGGSLVRLAPRTFRYEIIDDLKAEVLTLGNNIYGYTDVTVTFPETRTWADLPTSGEDVIGLVAAYAPGSSEHEAIKKSPMTLVPGSAIEGASGDWCVQHGLNASLWYTNGRDVQVWYAFRPDTSAFDYDTDLETDVGLSAEVVEAVIYGAAYREMMRREAARANISDMSQGRIEEMPPQHNAQVAEMFRRTRSQLLAAESYRLQNKFPIRIV